MNNVNQPLVSVVFTSYNHREYLKQALDSIVDQSYPNLEVIVVDDNSSDGSQEILKTYSTHPRVSLHLLEKNTGSYVKASNYGTRFANGEYLMFAQCDDYADPKQIEKLVAAMQQDQRVGVVYSRSSLIDKNGHIYDDDFRGREVKFKKRCSTNTLLSGEEMRRFLSYSCVIPNLSAALVKTALYHKVGKLSEKYLVASDWAFWLSLSEETNFFYITEKLNNFRQHDTTIRSKIKIEKQIVEIYNLFYHHIKKYHLSPGHAASIKRGAGLVWFSFILENFSAGLKSLPQVWKQTISLEKLNVLYLFLGAGIFTVDYFRRILSKL